MLTLTAETQVYMGRLDTERGPVLRVYEFDRYNGTVWQVDMLLANGSFVAHPRYDPLCCTVLVSPCSTVTSLSAFLSSFFIPTLES